MNAQEAIEFTKYELEEHLLLVKYYESQLPEDDEELIRFKNRGEALSIVLESAKLFHQQIIPMLQMENEKIGMSNPETVFGVPLEDVGIEKGADHE